MRAGDVWAVGDALSRLILVRHGETAGQSSIRYYGATDVPLSPLGRDQARAAKARIPGETYEAVWSSSLCRAWASARIIAPGRDIRIEADFREIDFGRWEGLTREEIAELDPARFAQWESEGLAFGFPDGETRPAFRARIERGLARLRASGSRSVLVVAHKGVVRTLLELVAGQTLEPADPELGAVIHASRTASGEWITGRPGSDASCGEPALGVPLEQA